MKILDNLFREFDLNENFLNDTVRRMTEEERDGLIDNLFDAIYSEEEESDSRSEQEIENTEVELEMDEILSELFDEDSQGGVQEEQDLFTLVLAFEDENLRTRLERAIESLSSVVDVQYKDVVVYHLLEELHRESVLEHKIVSLDRHEARVLAERLDLLNSALTEDGFTIEEYLEVDITEGIPFNEAEDEEEDTQSPFIPYLEDIEPVEEVEEEPQQPVRRRSTTNDYGLAWDIYSMGYASGDVAYLYNTSAGSISRGIRQDGHEMRTGAETRAMRKVHPNHFGSELIGQITELLADKFDTREEQNNAFHKAFGVNLYELTLQEADNEEVGLEEQATSQGISLHDLVRQELEEDAYEGIPLTDYMLKVRGLHNEMERVVSDLFGDINKEVGGVTVSSKLSYENGVVLTVRDAYKIKEKAVAVDNVVMTVKVADYLIQSMERELEMLSLRFESLVRSNFRGSDGEEIKVMNFGNSLVVSLGNE